MKTFLFVDGTNLYAAQFELFGPKKFLDFKKFIAEIEKRTQNKFDQIYFYASYSPKSKKPTEKEKLYLKNEALFYRSVRKTGKVDFFTGYRSKTSGREKAVDVKLAVDIVDFGHRKKFDKVVLVSGDADFMEALFAVRRIDKKIEVICLENKVIFKSLVFFHTSIIFFNCRNRVPEHIKQATKIQINEKSLLVKI